MADDRIVPGKLDDFESYVGTAERIGDVEIQTTYGPVYAVDAPGLTTIVMTCEAKPGERWEDNPWLVALTFRVINGNIDRIAA